MKVIGITGGVGSGKTQVLEYLNDKYGATICLTDEVARKLQRKGGEVFKAIVAHFGEEILDEKGELDRSKLAGIVFSDSEELAVLNSLVHPAVKEEVRNLKNLESENELIITNIRHKDLINKAKTGLMKANNTVKDGLPVDMISINIQEAIKDLCEILGESISDDVLNRIFEKFCVGK